MKAAVCVSAKTIEIKEVPNPQSTDGYVVIEVIKSGICGADLHLWHEPRAPEQILGHEFSGRVIDPGSRTDLKPGDRVTAVPSTPCGQCLLCKAGFDNLCPENWSQQIGNSKPGAMAQQVCVKPDMVFRLPDNVTDVEGALIEPAAVGLHAATLSGIQDSTLVLVIGAGPIGLVCAQFAKIRGAKYVAITDPNAARGALALKLGVADEFYDASSEEATQALMSKVGDNLGYDVVIDTVTVSATVGNAINYCRPTGTLTLVGTGYHPVTILSVLIVAKALKVLGSCSYTLKEFQEVLDLVSAKKIDLEKFATREITLSETGAAFDDLAGGLSKDAKILIDMTK